MAQGVTHTIVSCTGTWKCSNFGWQHGVVNEVHPSHYNYDILFFIYYLI